MVSEDPHAYVRECFVDKFPDIFKQCQRHASPDLEYHLNDLLLDIIIKYLYEGSKEISRRAFINLIKIIGLIETNEKKIEEKIFPAILDLSKNTNYETNCELNLMAIRLMARTAYILGPEKKELILDRFLQYCSFRMDQFRKTCASVFPCICYAMGEEYTESTLLDHFFKLCRDSFWGVRKACAEAITSLSLLCSLQCRKERIAPVVLNLAKDDSRWVVCITLKKLGPFISTFAEPRLLGLFFSEYGELHIINPTDEDFESHATDELIANYQYYLNKFAEAESQPTTNNCQRRCYEDALCPKDIAQRIIETKRKLFEQVHYDDYLKMRMYSCRDIDSSLENNKNSSDCTSTSFKSQKDYSLFVSNLVASRKEEESDLNSSHYSTEDNKDNSNVFEYSNINEGLRKTTGELHTKNRRIAGPSDLSSIIKKAIDEVHEKNKIHPPPLIRQPSMKDEDLNTNSNTQNSSENKSADVIQTDIIESLIEEFNLFVSPDSAEQTKSSSSPQKVMKSRRSDIHAPFSTLERNKFGVENSENNMNKLTHKIYSDLESTNHDSYTSGSEDDSFLEYNSHKYWYINPDLPLDPDLVTAENRNRSDDYGIPFDGPLLKVVSHNLPTDFQQDIVPPTVLKTFVYMVSYGEEEGINLSCAQNFPAVALTIGKSNWHLLKSLLQYLCDDLDWKVRKTIASYIDLLAMILGREIASMDLLPIYVGFFKDLDEVKIMAIKNAANFLKVIDHQKHEDILSRIGDCLRVDSKTNWRIKEDLAKQVLLLIRMYNFVDKEDSFLYITSLTALFLEDKISCVREIAADAMVEIIRIANQAEREGIVKLFLVTEFALSDNWRKRQTFLNTLLKLIKCDQPPIEVFRLVLSSVRNLSYDPVPNVRLLVAKCLNELKKIDDMAFKLKDFENINSVAEIIRRLKADDDRDVRDVLGGIEEAIFEWDNLEVCEDEEQLIGVPEEKEAPSSPPTEEIEIKLMDGIFSESQT